METTTTTTTTYVTAFINVPAIDNNTTRRQPDDYKRVCQPLLQQNINLLYFGDPAMAAYVQEERTRLGFQEKTHVVPLSYEELPAYRYLPAIQAAIAANGIMGAPACQRYTPAYLVTILSKVFLLDRAATENPFRTTHFCWHDFGLYHLKDTYWSAFQTINPSLFTEIDRTWPRTENRIKIILISPFSAISATTTLAQLCSRDQHIVNGAFFGGSLSAIQQLITAYTRFLDALLAAGYITNEEGILAQLFVTTPDQFDINAGYYSTTLPNIVSTRTAPERLSLQLYDCHRMGWHDSVIQLCWKALAGLQQGYVTYPPEQLRDIFRLYLDSLTSNGNTVEARYVEWEAEHREATHRGHRTTSNLLPWTYHHGKDSLYNDIRQIPAPFTLADLFREATTTPGCVGFTTTGWLKHRIVSPLGAAWYAPTSGIFTLIPQLEITETE